MPSQSSSRSSFADPLERLVGHLVSAKRALASTNQVYRANEIVTTARASLEENAILRAKNSFIRQSLQQQLDSLRAVQHGIGQVGQEAQSDLKVTSPTETFNYHIVYLLCYSRQPLLPSMLPTLVYKKHSLAYVIQS